jgi:hypothetical protein
MWWLDMAFFSVVVIDDWPTTVSNVVGLYFLAETTKFSMCEALYQCAYKGKI